MSTRSLAAAVLLPTLLVAACGDDAAPAEPPSAASGGVGGAGGASGAGGEEVGGAGTSAGGAGAAGAAGAMTAAPDLSPVACDACFPVESLPAPLRSKAEQLLLAALDHEALYTVFGGLKPMSSGIRSLTVPADEVDGEAVNELRTIAGALRCGGALESAVHLFAPGPDGTRTAELYVVRRPRFGETTQAYPDVFAPLAVDADTAILTALDRIDVDPSTKRFAAYGHLFGYPDHAVTFFVEAEETERAGGGFVERDFLHIPAYKAATGAFTYAVPKGHVPNEADLALAAAAKPIFNAYSRTRGELTTPIARKLVSLVRTAFDDGNGLCHPDHAAGWIEQNGDDLPVCAKAGKHCSANADCCSGDCHGDHCH